ncbi:hypothetical protein SETIT_9G289700v2 [Setaria italica]|uniref:Uncharacterized protein n=1 Tax=Setaria italica TaxID=4555 RepID=A0A368SLS0_SETIT|nr:hypothetical protein SETIT_9G289700v2 [Setaria italica]
MDSLTSLANAHGGDHDAGKETELALKIGNVNYCETGDTLDKGGPKICNGPRWEWRILAATGG